MSKGKKIYPVESDPFIEKLSGSAITVGDKTLEEYVDEEEEKERIEEADTVMKEGAVTRHHYHKQRVKGRDRKQRDGIVKKWSQFEINQRERSSLMKRVETVNDAVLLKLISSDDHLSIADFTEFAKNACDKSDLTRSSVASVMTRMKRSELGYFIDGDNDPDGRGFLYWLVPEARNMTLDQIRRVTHMRDKNGLSEVLEAMPVLEKYVAKGNRWLEHDSRSSALKAASAARSKKAKEVKNDTGKEVTETEVKLPDMIESNSVINKVIEESIKSALGVNVMVSGRVDIVFQFKLG